MDQAATTHFTLPPIPLVPSPNPSIVWQVTGQSVRSVLVRRVVSGTHVAVSRFVTSGYCVRAIRVAAEDLFATKAEAAAEFERRGGHPNRGVRRVHRSAPESIPAAAPAI